MKNRITWKMILLPVLAGMIFFTACKKEITFTTKAKPELVILPGNDILNASIIHFVKDTVYVLGTNLNIKDGQTLTIDAGTLIKVRDKFAVEINAGGKIESNGTNNEPVIFTSASLKGVPGKLIFSSATNENESFWYGITISGTAGVSSGNINYTRIEFAGGYRGFDEASLTLNNVDSLTNLQGIQVSYSYFNASLKISGGNCNASNLVSYASSGSDFIISDGYKGGLQYLLAYRHPYFAPDASSGTSIAGLVLTGSNTFPAISNMSVIGPGSTQSGIAAKYYSTYNPSGGGFGSRVAALLVQGGEFYIRNSVFAGFPKTAFYLDNRASARSLEYDYSEYTNCITQCSDTSRLFFLTPGIYPPYNSSDFKGFLLRPIYNNQVFLDFNALSLTDPFNYDINPDPMPASTSLLLSGANFDGPIFSNAFFKKTTFLGALGNENWLTGWTNFIPLQTAYNP